MLDYYYLKLHERFLDKDREEEVEVTLPELTALFQCSGRNVNLVLKRLEALEWIRYTPGRGRGNRSRLKLLIPGETVALETAQDYVRKGDIQQAFAYLEGVPHLQGVKDQFVYWLDTQFGFRPHRKNDRQTDTLRLPYSKRISCLDPAHLYYLVECHIVEQVFDMLVRYREETDTYEGGLAHHWTMSKDEKEWLFYLRKGVYFHHGREMTSEDVKFTLERLKSEELRSPFRWLFADVQEVRCIDRYTVHIRLERANPLFLQHLSYNRASIVPYDAVTEMGERFEQTPIGTGAFKVVQHDANMLVLEAFGRYYDRRAHLDRIEIWYTPELLRKASQLESMCYSMRYEGCSVEGGETPEGWKSIEKTGRDCSFLTFNLELPGPQHSLAFRKAVQHAIDRRLLIPKNEEGDRTYAKWFYEDGQEYSDTDENYDPILARRFLSESGYAGEVLLLNYHNTYGEVCSIQEQLGRIGIRTELVQRHTSCSVEARASEAHLWFHRNIMDEQPELSIIELFLAENSVLRLHLGEELRSGADWLIERLYQESSKGTRRTYLERLRTLVTEQASVIFLFQHTQRTIFHPSLKNVSLGSLGWVRFRDLWFEPAYALSGEEERADLLQT
ncbi:family 5 extracellular solute-binding protein [Paenibacillus mucilaginosus 3016]|uniref:Family 5 extracellular solute-binding protein n=1 Tax=Paenibacillus mucilaginosus 3016 TaxID=1116391 RepID=H6NJ66_9BACL|nr:ABC transporter substrate-binding protein [Paenibacillus mucilaginosus]AFC28828.1 family 5 extracellular solute-binding protein [Paenibacillus mucilaginosus 3016]WFA17590.1 ABC transporter substrate-binding protein [Paenibacillus mucilaginosus]